MFPTCVGMNRNPHPDDEYRVGVPHMRGDEPAENLYWEGANSGDTIHNY